MAVIYGYVVLNSETGQRFPTQKVCYNSKAAAAAGFNLITRRMKSGYGYIYEREGLSKDLAGVKIKDQTLYKIYPLVAQHDE